MEMTHAQIAETEPCAVRHLFALRPWCGTADTMRSRQNSFLTVLADDSNGLGMVIGGL